MLVAGVLQRARVLPRNWTSWRCGRHVARTTLAATQPSRCSASSLAAPCTDSALRPEKPTKNDASAPPKRVRGMHDKISPSEVLRRQIIRRAFVDTAERYSYSEVETPLVEDTSLFLRTLGDASDVVGKEMYTFLDRSKNSLSLRPEGTAGAMRAIMADVRSSSSGSTVTPHKVYYHGPMFRHERPQKGRYRQFTQLGVEYVGGPNASTNSSSSNDGASSSPLVDAEVIGLARHFLEDIRIAEQCTLRINTLGSPACRKRYQQELLDYFQALPHGAESLSEASAAKLELGRVLRILDSKDPIDQKAVAKAPIIEEFLAPEARERHDALLQLLDIAGIPYVQDWHLVRGLDYYCHTAFEFVYDGGSGGALGAAQGTVLAGGRYDALAGYLGWRGGGQSATDLPAIGWAAGMERLELVLPDTLVQERAPPPVVTVGFLRTTGCPTINDCASTMAAFHGLCTSIQAQQSEIIQDGSSENCGGLPFRLHRHHAAGKMRQLLRVCEETGSPILLLVGVDELSAGLVTVRDLRTRRQESVPVAEVQRCVQEMLFAELAR